MFDRFASSFGFPFAKQASEGFPALSFGSSFSFASPAVDFTEEAAAYKMTAELPGMTEKDIEVGISGDVLTLKGEKRQEREDKAENYHISERAYGSFQRSFYIPDGADREKIAAVFAKGVLTVTLPKTAEAQSASKKIEVKAG
jgi:HSP20 family protein